jgi:hypothetical protein
VEGELAEVEGRVFKVRPFGGERCVNMRDLNPGGRSGLRVGGGSSQLTNEQIRISWLASKDW